MSGAEGHPLFPVGDEGDDPPEVEWIAVKRFERGTWVVAPRMFQADELIDLEQLADMYGGGSYELEARAGGASGRQRWTRKIKYTLPGPSKPMVDLPVDDAPEPPPTLPALAGADSNTNMVALVLQMSQQSNQLMMGMLTQSMQMFGQMMTALLGNQRNDQAAIAKVIADMSAADKSHLATILTALGGRGGGGGSEGALQAFLKGVKFREELGADDAPQDTEGSIMESLGQMIGGLQAFSSMQPPPGAAVPPPAVVPHVPQEKPNA